jgi:alpha-1,3-fucosyltransferase
MDSDIRFLYGRVHDRTSLLTSVPSNYYYNVNMTEITDEISHQEITTTMRSNKTGKVVWMASHCGTFSRREDYVIQLAKHIPVDVFGNCGFESSKNSTCPRNGQWISDPDCYVQMASQYKFYLSFENSICTDYIVFYNSSI